MAVKYATLSVSWPGKGKWCGTVSPGIHGEHNSVDGSSGVQGVSLANKVGGFKPAHLQPAL